MIASLMRTSSGWAWQAGVIMLLGLLFDVA
jgi:hypothetical protein